MSTISHPYNAPDRHAPLAIPERTSRVQLERLGRRYRNETDPTIAMLPAWYRQSMITRIEALLRRDKDVA
jgi:hypothetical protein